jgi:hypothetical protein
MDARLSMLAPASDMKTIMDSRSVLFVHEWRMRNSFSSTEEDRLDGLVTFTTSAYDLGRRGNGFVFVFSPKGRQTPKQKIEKLSTSY